MSAIVLFKPGNIREDHFMLFDKAAAIFTNTMVIAGNYYCLKT